MSEYQCFDCGVKLEMDREEVYAYQGVAEIQHFIDYHTKIERLSEIHYSIDLCHDCALHRMREAQDMVTEAVEARPPQKPDEES